MEGLGAVSEGNSLIGTLHVLSASCKDSGWKWHKQQWSCSHLFRHDEESPRFHVLPSSTLTQRRKGEWLGGGIQIIFRAKKLKLIGSFLSYSLIDSLFTGSSGNSIIYAGSSGNSIMYAGSSGNSIMYAGSSGNSIMYAGSSGNSIMHAGSSENSIIYAGSSGIRSRFLALQNSPPPHKRKGE